FEHLLGSLRALDLDAVASRADADAALAEPIPNPTVRGFLMQNLRRDGHDFTWQPNLELLYTSLPRIAGFPDQEDATFDGPTLWIAGGRSEYVTDEAVPIMRSLFPNVRKATVKQAGHWVHSQRPEEFLGLLRAFLPGEA
ncbi:MAG TPA: alpha/beta hydrolase, partial [Candidatus Agrococcus pullicola]|nr:alpha/beta hydrolase [Candidatus Agrococcus pullicola]